MSLIEPQTRQVCKEEMSVEAQTVAASTEQANQNFCSISASAEELSTTSITVAASVEEMSSSLDEIARNCQGAPAASVASCISIGSRLICAAVTWPHGHSAIFGDRSSADSGNHQW